MEDNATLGSDMSAMAGLRGGDTNRYRSFLLRKDR